MYFKIEQPEFRTKFKRERYNRLPTSKMSRAEWEFTESVTDLGEGWLWDFWYESEATFHIPERASRYLWHQCPVSELGGYNMLPEGTGLCPNCGRKVDGSESLFE